MKVDLKPDGTYRNVFDKDVDYSTLQVTNFYKLFPADEYGFDDGNHGLERYKVLAQEVLEHRDHFTESEAMTVLSHVYQDFGVEATSATQWSVVYNPNAMTMRISTRTDRTDRLEDVYSEVYLFNFKEVFDCGKAMKYTTHTE